MRERPPLGVFDFNTFGSGGTENPWYLLRSVWFWLFRLFSSRLSTRTCGRIDRLSLFIPKLRARQPFGSSCFSAVALFKFLSGLITMVKAEIKRRRKLVFCH
ncbi:hypothetical protein BDW42DRAFT_170894 [Aspergillus taichungensis]|uniref:Uncharacterized protein n=1 Tax=Aspergillus taichungensis TaxID=482145 RepID=A0A2J5HT12_9EURO|nr:hypothetical protein BDW42DRAFT_170894 [Aspergillus taichungensis]